MSTERDIHKNTMIKTKATQEIQFFCFTTNYLRQIRHHGIQLAILQHGLNYPTTGENLGRDMMAIRINIRKIRAATKTDVISFLS